MKNFYVYKLEDPITRQFYFGSRSCNCEPINDNYMGSMVTWKPVNKDRLIKTIIKHEFSSMQDALKYESVLIRENIKNPLNENYYIPDAGFYNKGGRIYSEASKKLMSENHADVSGRHNPMYGKTHTDASKRKMVMASTGENNIWYGKKRPNHSKKMIGLFVGGKSVCSKKVYQFDKNNVLIKEWDSQQSAARALGISQSNITNCCNNKFNVKTVGGYIWKHTI